MYGGNDPYTYVYIDDKDIFVKAYSFQHKIALSIYDTGFNPVKSAETLTFKIPHHVYAILYTIDKTQNIFLINLENKNSKIGNCIETKYISNEL